MNHRDLLAIAIGSACAVVLPRVFAGNPPATDAPASEVSHAAVSSDDGRAQAGTPESSQSSEPRDWRHDESGDHDDRDARNRADVRKDTQDIRLDRADLRTDRRDLKQDRANLAPSHEVGQPSSEQRPQQPRDTMSMEHAGAGTRAAEPASGSGSDRALTRSDASLRADMSTDRNDIRRDQADIRKDQQDLHRDRTDLRADERDMQGDREGTPRDDEHARASVMDERAHQDARFGGHDHDASRDARDDLTSDRRDIRGDKADIRKDQQDLQRDRADLRADQRDLRQDRGQTPAQRSQQAGRDWRKDQTVTATNGRQDGREINATARAGANTKAVAGQDWRKPGLTSTTLANNAAQNAKTKTPTHAETSRAWYHYFWW